MSSFTDTKAREKVVDFVTYFSAGTSFYVKARAGTTIKGLARPLRAYGRGRERNDAADDATAQSAKCKKAGKAGVTVSVFPDQNGANLALSSGRAQVGMADSPVAAYIVKQSKGQFKLTGKPTARRPTGSRSRRATGWRSRSSTRVKALMANGTYKSILAKWGIQAGAITNPKINGAIKLT